MKRRTNVLVFTCVLGGFLGFAALELLDAHAQTQTQVQTPATTGLESRFDKLINDATGKIVKRFNGTVPDDLKAKVQKELNKELSGEHGQKILDRLESKIPARIKDKLPEDLLTTLGGVKMTSIEHITYEPGSTDLAHQMSVYLPPMKGSKFPLIIYVHGGGWQSRPTSSPTWVNTFVKQGYAVACVNYRLSNEGVFPAQIEDLNSALRFLKQNAAKINVDPARIGIFGASAGGHLAALMGTSENSLAMDLGAGDKSVSRKVAAVCDWYGPTELYELGTKAYPANTWDLSSPTAPLSLLLGGQASNKRSLAESASPMTYVAAGNPPILIMHGSADTIIPVSQSQEFDAALKKAGVDVTYIELPGIGHGFQDKNSLNTVRTFFDKHLK